MPTPTDVALEYLRRFAARDVAGLLALTADDATYRSADGGVHPKEATAQVYGMLAALFSDLKVEVLGTTAQDDRVAVEAAIQGGLADGREYRNSVHYLFVVADGHITALREYSDTKPTDVLFSAVAG
ncbi:nuclear transport factor 2 family protein [Pseudonocardia pini]|uniref:nuclear transport factor 2 family protein n=1 Tax=Pseudonocardia pini TaxID=2758030 RepID=UPI0015F0DF5C|nr:nuclear transport factor 2 family protein [Pseudonocardia pini]